MTVHVPLVIKALNCTFPLDITTLKSTASVVPFKSGVEYSVQTTFAVSQVAITTPVLVELSDGLTK